MPLQSDQTMRLSPCLLLLLPNQPALSAANWENNSASLITSRVEKVWQKYAHFTPRCEEYPQLHGNICPAAQKFLPNISVHASFLKVKLLFGQPHGVGAITMMDNTCALYNFHQGRPVGIATFYRGGKLIRMQEGETQWTKRSLGPVVWFEQQTGKARLLLVRVEGIEEEVAVVRNGTNPLYSRVTLDTGVRRRLSNESEPQSLPNVRFIEEEKGAEKIPTGKNMVSAYSAVFR